MNTCTHAPFMHMHTCTVHAHADMHHSCTCTHTPFMHMHTCTIDEHAHIHISLCTYAPFLNMHTYTHAHMHRVTCSRFGHPALSLEFLNYALNIELEAAVGMLRKS